MKCYVFSRNGKFHERIDGDAIHDTGEKYIVVDADGNVQGEVLKEPGISYRVDSDPDSGKVIATTVPIRN